MDRYLEGRVFLFLVFPVSGIDCPDMFFSRICAQDHKTAQHLLWCWTFFPFVKNFKRFSMGREANSSHGNLLGWSKSSFGFFHKILWKAKMNILFNPIHYFWFKNCLVQSACPKVDPSL